MVSNYKINISIKSKELKSSKTEHAFSNNLIYSFFGGTIKVKKPVGTKYYDNPSDRGK